jgi:hypothetical protein
MDQGALAGKKSRRPLRCGFSHDWRRTGSMTRSWSVCNRYKVFDPAVSSSGKITSFGFLLGREIEFEGTKLGRPLFSTRVRFSAFMNYIAI